MTPRPEKTAGKIVTATTHPFNGLQESSATARCPAGYICTGGGIDVPEGAAVTASRPADDGTGWYASFAGGPSGHTGTVRAVCEPEKASPSGD